ncbi:MAG: phosphate ABC transporter substrate-binding protein [candidate division WOR-3 bacterium]|nr:phosphate ABC transporter substrate-binding protein [candidate division WOR-3 bacterium]
MKKLLTTIAVLAALVAAGAAKEVMVKGSDTMLNLVQNLAEAFSTANPDITVSVTGGGSGVGISAVVNKQTDVGDASRAITSKEISGARANGVNPVEYAIAIDGVCIIVNASNSVEKLTIEQLGQLYQGKIANWSAVGGPNQNVSLYGRQPNSGTFVYVRDEAVKADYAASMRQMNGNAQIVEAVKGDEGAIGYVGVGYAREQGVKVLQLSKDGTNYYSPLDEKAISTNIYPLARPLFQYTNGKAKGDAKAFIEFEVGPEGQKIVADQGFYPLTQGYKDKNAANLQ